MPVYTYNLLYLGNAADIDTDETDLLAENAADLLGTYGTSEDPLANHIVSASVNDADNDTNINTDNDHFPSSETVTIDGSAKVMDSAVVYDATITYTDGTTATITAVIMQSTDGG
ncbi:MAG: hemolysin, partial [Pseudorhodobacter sp.]